MRTICRTLMIFVALAAPALALPKVILEGTGRDVPVTFAMVFAPGAVPPGTSLSAADKSGAALPLQVDAKARNRDGSLRHAVLTVVAPRLDATVQLNAGNPAAGAPVALSALPSDLDTTVTLDLGERKLTASVREMLARGKPETWLSGPLVSEWWIAGPLRDGAGKPDPNLSVRFGLRSYGAGKPLRVEVDVENTWTWTPHPRSYQYAVEIRNHGKIAFASAKLIQHARTRWRQVLWWDQAVDANVRFDLADLKAARAIPNYAARDINMEERTRQFTAKNRGPMQTGVIYPAMPVTGQRSDIGPLPGWTVAWLLTMDRRAADIMLNAGDLGGSFPAHFRNEKTGRPSTSEDFPKISTHYNFVGRGNGNLPLVDLAGLSQPFTAEPSHEPSLAFVPYLITGDRYYLEEMQFWSQWNAWGTAPEYHGFAKGLIGWDQIRGQGWSLRTLAQAAYATPDGDPLKGVLLRQMKANAEWYDKAYTNNPQANIFHVALRASDTADSVAPWMDDYLTWATQYAVGLGFDEFRPFARWKGVFPVQRMINPDYCYIMATKYYMKLMDAPHRFINSWAAVYFANLPKGARSGPRIACGSDEMTRLFKLRMAGEMMGDAVSPGGYPAQMQPALAAAVDAGVPGAREAWAKFKDRRIKPREGIEPKWDILPWTN
jgi:hypothetical protein